MSDGGFKCGVGLPPIGGPCGRVGVNSGEVDASLVLILDAVIRIDVDVSGSLVGFSSYEVGVPVFYQGDTEMIEPTCI